MSNTTIEKSIFLKAAPEVVWSYLTQKDRLAEWFHEATADLEPNQAYELFSRSDNGETQKLCWGTVLEMEPHSHLKYTFTVKPLNGALTTVTWTLEEVHGGTRLSLLHEGIEAAAGEAAMGLLLALDRGWDEHLSKIRAALH